MQWLGRERERGREGKLGWKTSCMLPWILGRLYKRLGDQLFLTILAANSTSFSHIPSLFSIPDIVHVHLALGKLTNPENWEGRHCCQPTLLWMLKVFVLRSIQPLVARSAQLLLVQSFAESLEQFVRSQTAIPSLYGRHWTLIYPYKECTELWGII